MSDYENLKKKYGENFAKFCRANFSTTLEEEGVLSKFLEEEFIPNKTLYDDLMSQNANESFISYVYYYLSSYMPANSTAVKKTPFELMKKAEYTLFECKKNSDIKKFKKYYAEGEEICTFRDPDRVKNNYVFFALKDNVETIKRENFKNPQREDEYGTSVISIQFNKYTANLSIKNRYNHKVKNPDATFGNNLEKIIPGLTSSFNKYCKFNINKFRPNLELENYHIVSNSSWCRYNLEINKVFYCDNNRIIINDKVYQFDKNRYILIDQFLIDKEKKTMVNLEEYNISVNTNSDQKSIITSDDLLLKRKKSSDSFIDLYKDIDKINITKGNDGERIIEITVSGQVSYITVDKNNCIIKYENNYMENVGFSFLHNAKYLKSLTAKNLKSTKDEFCYNAEGLQHLSVPKLEDIGDYFLSCSKISSLELPSAKRIGNNIMFESNTLKSLSAPLLERVGHNFLQENTSLESLSLPSLKTIGSNFLYNNEVIKEINLPQVKEIADGFLYNAKNIEEISLPKTEYIGRFFMNFNLCLNQIHLPKVKYIDFGFLRLNKSLKEITLPNCETVENCFLESNVELEKLIAPKLKSVGKYFIYENKKLRTVALPSLQKIQEYFLKNSKRIKDLIAPKLKACEVQYNSNRKISHLIKRQIKLKKKLEEKEK